MKQLQDFFFIKYYYTLLKDMKNKGKVGKEKDLRLPATFEALAPKFQRAGQR